MATQIISPSGQKNYQFGTWDQSLSYRLGDTVIYNGAIYTANDAVPAGTPFTIGATGATWTDQVIGGGGPATSLVNGI